MQKASIMTLFDIEPQLANHQGSDDSEMNEI